MRSRGGGWQPLQAMSMLTNAETFTIQQHPQFIYATTLASVTLRMTLCHWLEFRQWRRKRPAWNIGGLVSSPFALNLILCTLSCFSNVTNAICIIQNSLHHLGAIWCYLGCQHCYFERQGIRTSISEWSSSCHQECFAVSVQARI